MSIRSWWKNAFSNGNASIKEASSPILKISVGDKHVANLYHDESDFCLTYLPGFFEVGIPPFNPEDLHGSLPKIDNIYRSKNLWFVFEDRIGSLDRRDFAEEMRRLGLTKDSDPLELLGKLGAVSIGKPWRLELVRKAT